VRLWQARVQATDEEAATKVQALQRGKSARRGDAQALAAIEASDLDVLQKLVASGARFSATALVAALDSPVRALASLLVSQQSAWNVPEHDLAIWNLVQAAISPPPVEDEDDEEPEEVDVEDEEWQEEIAAKVFGAEGDANYDADAIYHVRRVVSVGCYAGGRAQMAQTHEPAFDDELTEREGYGVHLGPKGGVYAGYWQDGRRHGVGVYLYPDKSVYCGEWKEGMKHGSGRMAYADGGVYEGSWKYNKRHGHGVFTYPNGDLHVGKWFTGAKHGEGKYTNKQSGCRYIGVWREGALSQATVKTPDGRTMLSGFEAGEPEGAGAFVMPSGVVARGAHSHAPKADDEDADEELPKTVLRWEGESLSHADRTTTPKLAAMHAGAAGAAPGQRKAMLIAPDYGGSGGGAFPPLDVSPSAHKLKEVLVGKLAFADVDVDVVTGERSSKEAVTEALTELAGRLGRGDVAFVALLGHGKKLLDLDNEDLEPGRARTWPCTPWAARRRSRRANTCTVSAAAVHFLRGILPLLGLVLHSGQGAIAGSMHADAC